MLVVHRLSSYHGLGIVRTSLVGDGRVSCLGWVENRTGAASVQPHGVGIAGDPRDRLPQAGLDHLGGHHGVQQQAGPQPPIPAGS
jgi:hypothetical protein